MTKKQKLVIAVTGLNAIDSPGPGVAVIRAIREYDGFECRIIGLSYESLEPGIYMHDVVDKTYQIPYPSAGTDNLYSRLMQIHDKEKLNIVIPNFDAELFNFIKISDKLLAAGIRTYLPDLKQFEARDKLKLHEFGQKHDLLVPADMIINNISQLKDISNTFEFPVVVKGKYYDAIVANTAEQMEKAFFKIQAKWGLPVIVQEFINGTEINIAALGDGMGNTLSVIPMRKLYITDKGKAWAGITLDDDNFVEMARRFVAATHWRGGCELEVIQKADGRSYILEVNPRFPAWIYLTAAAGQNQPAMLVKLAMGEAQPALTDYEVGKIFVRYSWDLITDISEFQQISVNGEL